MADDLYALPLEDFISARDAAAKELRRSGDREGAAVLAKLPKPTPAAWAANQIARTEPELLQGFLDAGEALRSAQEAALNGEPADLREATRAQRAAVDGLMAAAAPLQPAGKPLSRAMGDRLRTTLLAAAGNEELSHALAEGRLALEALAGGAWPPPDAEDRAAGPRRAPAKPAGKQASDDRRIVTDSNKRARRKATKAGGATSRGAGAAGESDAAADREAAAEREARAKAKREREALEKELRDARGALKVLQRALTSAEKDANRATARLDAALAEAEAAREDADAMHKLLDEAREVLATTRDEIARLEERLD